MKKSSQDPNKPVCSSWLSSEDDPITEETSGRSTPSDSAHTPILSHHAQATSTPCPPKSQPPTRTDHSENEYDMPETKMIEDFINETGMTVISDESRTVVAVTMNTQVEKFNTDNDEYVYQVPSNLDINTSTCL